MAEGGALVDVQALTVTGNTVLPTCDAVAVRDSSTPVEWCILGNLADACVDADDCFIRQP